MPAGYLTKEQKIALAKSFRKEATRSNGKLLVTEEQLLYQAYNKGYEAGKKEVLDAFFPEEVKKELIKVITENLVEKRNG